MKIVIAGAGDVGTHLAKLLSREDQDIMVIDKSADRLQVLDDNYNLMTHQGSPISFAAQMESGVDSCDLFIAVTPSETDNITACAIAKSIGAKTTVGRIDNYEYMSPEHIGYFNSIGVDSLIYPEYLAAREILDALEHPWARNWFELHQGELILIGVKPSDDAPIIGMQLKQFGNMRHDFHVSAIKRGYETIIPRGDDYIKCDDIVYFMTRRDYVEELQELCGKHYKDIRRVMIVGGSRIAIRFASLASDKYRIKILDCDRDRCRKLSEKCPECSIVMADGRDIETLREEGIEEVDAFIALTGSSETNILSSLTAKQHNVYKTVAEVEDIQFIPVAEGLNIVSIVNKKLIASSRIFQLLLDADSSTTKCLSLADAEVLELEVKPGSKITRQAVRDLRLPREITIAGLVRDGHGLLVDGNTTLRPGDHAMVFCLQGSIHKAEKLFN